MVYSNGSKMIGKDANRIKSLTQQMHYEEVGFAYLNETSKPLLEILQNGDNTVDLEKEDFKKYIHI